MCYAHIPWASPPFSRSGSDWIANSPTSPREDNYLMDIFFVIGYHGY